MGNPALAFITLLLSLCVLVLRFLYRTYVELKGRCERLQWGYGRICADNARLYGRMMAVRPDSKQLLRLSAGYTRVKRVFAQERSVGGGRQTAGTDG